MPNGVATADDTRTQTLLLVTGAGALVLGFLALQAAKRPPTGVIPCTTTPDCPSGMVCVGGECVADGGPPPPPPPPDGGPPPPPPPPPGTAINYTIVSGDTLWGIATRFCGEGICWWWLWQQNLAVVGPNPNLIFPGQQLTIPQPCPNPCPLPPPGPVPCGGTYRVIAGDTLSSIALRGYGDANQWPRIFDANRAIIGNDPNLIFPGQMLFIPPPC